MRNVRALTILGLLTIVTLMVLNSGCKDVSKPKDEAKTNEAMTEQTKNTENPAEVAWAYACPMHPDQGSNEPGGVCPICGMNFQPTSKEEVGEAQVYACPMHPDQTSTDPNAACPVCGMKLEPAKASEEVEAQEYACPMHPDQTSTDSAAVCPICGMNLEPVKEVIEDDDEHGEDTAGTDDESEENETGETEQG